MSTETQRAIAEVWKKHWPSFSLIKKSSWDEIDAAIRADERALLAAKREQKRQRVNAERKRNDGIRCYGPA